MLFVRDMFDMVIYMEADEVFVEMAAINADEVNTAVRVGYGLLDLVSDVDMPSSNPVSLWVLWPWSWL